MSDVLVSLHRSRRAWMAMLAIAALVVPTAVSRASAESTDPSNRVEVSSSTVSSWSPAASWSTGNDPQNCGNLVFPSNSDIYHWVVQDQNGNNGLTGRSRKSWQYSADFTNGGSVDVEFMDGSTANYPRGTFNLTTIQSNHLWTALPQGAQVKKAWLNYNVAVSGDVASAPTITALTTNHNLSHSCASPLPTVAINSAIPSYTTTWENQYTWSLEKSLNLGEGENAKEKFFEVARKPEFKVEATRSATADASGWAIVDGTQKVSGSFTLTNARNVDTTITLADATCTTADDLVTTDLTYNYECIWGTESAVTGENGLTDVPFTVDASVTTSSGTATASTTGKFDGQSAGSGSSGTYYSSASLSDDLADLGGAVISCTGCSASVTPEDELTVGPTNGSFSVVYSVDWSWDQFEASGACTTAFTNTAELTVPSSPGDASPTTISDSLVVAPSCPPPTVTLKNVTSSYNVSYDNTYSWNIAKSFDGQDDENLRAKYTVTATRNAPEVSNVAVVNGSATISGEFDATYADLSNVDVTVSYDGNDFDCTEDSEGGTFECTITGLSTSDRVNGLKGDSFEVTAQVETGGGSDTDTSDDEFGVPDASTPNDIHASARVVDDLGAVAALNIACTVEGTEDSCWVNSSNALIAGSTLTTDYAESTITVTYELDWLDSADTSANCPSITNAAEIADDALSLDDATVTSQMTCPEAVITVNSSPNPTYNQTWTESYGWTVDKAFKRDDATWKPIYTVTATRGTSTVDADSHVVVDASQKVEGTFTIAMSPNVFEADIENTDVTLTMSGAECTIGDDEGSLVYPFSCVVSNEDSVSKTNGLNGVSFTVDAKAAVFGAEKSNSVDGNWGNQTSGSVSAYKNESARIVDNLLAVNGGVVLSGNASVTNKVLTSAPSSSNFAVEYLGNWDYSVPGACGQSISNTADIYSAEGGSALSSKTIVNTMKCDAALPGLTIGYWGNKQGGNEVVAKRTLWRTSGPWSTVLLSATPDFKTDAAVRDYMNKANCSGDCKTMFVAQALASVMNTLRNSAYQGQWVKFQGVCTKVQTLLNTALGGTTILNGPLNTRIAYKSIFDDLNNSRASRCPGI